MSDERPTNRLAGEASPYLLQHAHNPVDWYPWGEEALARARDQDRPVLLSIGYAACHWCHVMERESFEDPETAGLMNANFVCVKVDREERPDLDAIYMDAVQSMTGHGGWPMTVFLTPDGEPFFAGTYFPDEPRHGMPAFTQVLDAVAAAWREQRPQVHEQGKRVVAGIGRMSALHGSQGQLSEEVLRSAFEGARASFDPQWGGFGGAPKFPQPMTLEFLLRCHLRGYEGAVEMAGTTLDRMAWGGMYDQVGGGFHRYSVDERWHVPHFEKMLYDNAQLARVYLHAWQVTGVDRYLAVAVETLDYLLREMRHADGGFFSSQDADSEGVEGKFFVWSWDELVALAGEQVAEGLGATLEGNWEGANVLWRPYPMPDDAVGAVATARPRLFEAREQRVPPSTDDKVLAAWNGLAIVAFAEAGRVLEEPRYVEAALRALGFVQEHLVDGGGRLHRSWRDGTLGPPGFLDDHAAMGLAALAVYETTFDLEAFRFARRLADDLVRLFADPDRGGFFQTGSDAEALVVRPKELFDNAVPSGNSMGAELLERLAMLTGEAEYERAAGGALGLVKDLMERWPLGFGHALTALDLYLGPSREIAIVGDPAEPATRKLLAEVRSRYLPNAVVAASPPGPASRDIELLRDRPMVDGRATAYVCERFVCQLPVTEPAELAAQLAS